MSTLLSPTRGKLGRGEQPSRVLSPQTQRLLDLEGRMGPSTPMWQWGNGLGDGTKGGSSLSDVLSAGNRNSQCYHSHRRWRSKPSLCSNILEP